MGERVTITAAANELCVNKSTISRWCKSHPALRDAEGLVDADELRAHRDQVINPSLQTRGGKVDTTPIQRMAGASPTNLNDARQRTEQAKAEIAELDLLQRLSRTLDRTEVEAAVVAAAETLKAEAMQIVKDQAERLANISDARAMEVALREIMTDLMERSAYALNRASMPEGKPDAA